MNAPKKRSPFAIVRRLIVLVRPMLPVMLAAIAMGVAGYFCATFITIFGGFGLLAAAGLDVVYTEPIRPDNPLLTAKNCIITPHISWAPKESRQRIMDATAENIRAFLAGTPQNVVNH